MEGKRGLAGSDLTVWWRYGEGIREGLLSIEGKEGKIGLCDPNGECSSHH